MVDRMTNRSRRASALVVGVATVATAAILPGCGSDPAEAPGSVTEMVGSLQANEGAIGTYFSFDRYEAGSGLDFDAPADDALTEMFVERSADGIPSEPFTSALKLNRLDDLLIEPASVTSTYTQTDFQSDTRTDSNTVILLSGEFEPTELVGRVEEVVAGGDAAAGPAEAKVESDGEFERVDLSGDVETRSILPAAGVLGSDRSFALSEDRLVSLPEELALSDVLSENPDQSPLGDDDVRALVEALDENEVYSAFLYFGPMVPEDGGPTVVGGFGTGFQDDDEVAYTVLIHEDDEAAEANGDAVQTIMEDDANCADEVDLALDGPLLAASCKVTDAGWSNNVSGRLGLGPFSPG